MAMLVLNLTDGFVPTIDESPDALFLPVSRDLPDSLRHRMQLTDMASKGDKALSQLVWNVVNTTAFVGNIDDVVTVLGEKSLLMAEYRRAGIAVASGPEASQHVLALSHPRKITMHVLPTGYDARRRAVRPSVVEWLVRARHGGPVLHSQSIPLELVRLTASAPCEKFEKSEAELEAGA